MSPGFFSTVARRGVKGIAGILFLAGCAWAGHQAALTILPQDVIHARSTPTVPSELVIRPGSEPVYASEDLRALREALFAAENGLPVEDRIGTGKLVLLQPAQRV